MRLDRRRVWPRAVRQALAVARAREARYYNPGYVLISRPYVFAVAYGPNAIERSEEAYRLLSTPGWVWNDRTWALRRSVQIVDWRTVTMGNDEAFYAVYVEARLGPVQTAFELALEKYGFR